MNMPKNNLIAPDKISNKTTQFKTLELKTLKSVGIRKVVKAGQSFGKFTLHRFNFIYIYIDKLLRYSSVDRQISRENPNYKTIGYI